MEKSNPEFRKKNLNVEYEYMFYPSHGNCVALHMDHFPTILRQNKSLSISIDRFGFWVELLLWSFGSPSICSACCASVGEDICFPFVRVPRMIIDENEVQRRA